MWNPRRYFGGWLLVPLALVGCTGAMESQSGRCEVTRCTGVCLDQVQQFARDRLGSEAQDVFFSWDGNAGGSAPSSDGGTAIFSTEACPDGQYWLDFYGNAARCTNTFFGTVPRFVGELMVVPEGCDGPN